MKEKRQGGSVNPARPSNLGRPVFRPARGLMLVAVALALFSVPAAAQMGGPAPSPGRSFHIGLGGGVSVPAGDLELRGHRASPSRATRHEVSSAEAPCQPGQAAATAALTGSSSRRNSPV